MFTIHLTLLKRHTPSPRETRKIHKRKTGDRSRETAPAGGNNLSMLSPRPGQTRSIHALGFSTRATGQLPLKTTVLFA